MSYRIYRVECISRIDRWCQLKANFQLFSFVFTGSYTLVLCGYNFIYSYTIDGASSAPHTKCAKNFHSAIEVMSVFVCKWMAMVSFIQFSSLNTSTHSIFCWFLLRFFASTAFNSNDGTNFTVFSIYLFAFVRFCSCPFIRHTNEQYNMRSQV